MGKALILALYLSILLIYLLALMAQNEFHSIEKGHDIVLHTVDKFRTLYFTGWTFMLQILFLLTAILDESSKLLDFPVSTQKRLGRTRAFLFNTLVLPCSLLVTTVFWTIWHIDRELIFPKVIDTIFPVWLNHVLHTFIVVPIIIELALPKKYHFVRFGNAAVILLGYATFYQFLYFSVYLRHGVWLYGIYAALNWPQRIMYTLLQLSLLLVYQRIGIAIQDGKRINKTRKIH